MDGKYTMKQPAIMIWPQRLFSPGGFENSEPRYDCTILFDPKSEDMQAIVSLVRKLAAEAFPGVSLPKDRYPIKNGTEKADDGQSQGKNQEYYRGKLYIVPRSKMPPQLAYYDENNKIVLLENEMDRQTNRIKFFSGALVRAQINFSPYKKPSPGIGAYLNMLVSYNKGTPLAGAASPVEVFGGYVGTELQGDPTADQQVADEITF